MVTEKTTETTAPVKATGTKPTRWDPADVFETIQDEMNRFLTQAWPLGPWTMSRSLRRVVPTPATWVPKMDVFDKNGALVVRAELPGIKKEDVTVELEGGDLIVKGESKAESEVKQEDFYRIERSRGSFYRCLPLPFEVKPEQIKATYADGVLEIEIPKPTAPAAESKKIPVG
jgi:HSP20 family protein